MYVVPHGPSTSYSVPTYEDSISSCSFIDYPLLNALYFLILTFDDLYCYHCYDVQYCCRFPSLVPHSSTRPSIFYLISFHSSPVRTIPAWSAFNFSTLGEPVRGLRELTMLSYNYYFPCYIPYHAPLITLRSIVVFHIAELQNQKETKPFDNARRARYMAFPRGCCVPPQRIRTAPRAIELVATGASGHCILERQGGKGGRRGPRNGAH